MKHEAIGGLLVVVTYVLMKLTVILLLKVKRKKDYLINYCNLKWKNEASRVFALGCQMHCED